MDRTLSVRRKCAQGKLLLKGGGERKGNKEGQMEEMSSGRGKCKKKGNGTGT